MTQKAFNRLAAFTDLHIANKNNSPVFHQDCHDYVTWFIDQAKAFGAETCFFLGDLFHKRSAINVVSLNVALDIIERLSKAFETVYLIVGNHDMYYRNKRLINSIEIGRNIRNVVVVKDTLTIGDTTLMPYLVEEEWRAVKKLKSRYVFGHFELPGFLMNAMIEAPDHGGINATHFQHQEYVFSGHFHKRQQAGKVIYIGNAFPHNFADTWDDDRGCMLLEHGGTPQLVNWTDCPKYRTYRLSTLVEQTATVWDKTYLRVTVDTDLSYEETGFIKQSFLEMGAREVELQTPEQEQIDGSQAISVEFEPVDQIVEKSLMQIESPTLSPAYMIEIYQSL
jgi:DNA repair exonuclease SbcCD nuclease subunit